MSISVGDYVIGTEEYRYTITDNSCLCRVVGSSPTLKMIFVKVEEENSSHKGDVFEVEPRYFKVVKQCTGTADTRFKKGDNVKYKGRTSDGGSGSRVLQRDSVLHVLSTKGDTVEVESGIPHVGSLIIHADYLCKCVRHNNVE